jgi:hypothetical protein
VTLSNSSPNGGQLNKQVSRWALETCLGVTDRDPEPVTLSPGELSAYTGGYETLAGTIEITAADGHLVATSKIKPEVLATLMEAGEDEPDDPPIPLGLLPGPGDRYVVVDGPAKGMQGYFARSDSGEITGVHVGGRLATRTGAAAGG